MSLADSQIKAFRRQVLNWYTKHYRRLPWRARPKAGRQETIDAYRVLISETMLQQTQVATVIEYFHRFLEAFPTLEDLAGADEQQVLKLWQGLGYYRRARNLHAAAKIIVRDHGGWVPDDVTQLRRLPGVGRYTAGAIASIAHARREAVLDGNVTRVLARWAGIDRPVNQAPVIAELWQLAEELVSPSRPGDFNQAIMELGATLCSPRNPQCTRCPLADSCVARQSDRTQSLPRRDERKAPLSVRHDIVAARRRGVYLFEQRPQRGLWSRMWQLPTTESSVCADNDSAYDGMINLRQWSKDRFGLNITDPREAMRFVHQTTHRTIDFRLWKCEVTGGRLKSGAGVWRRLSRLDDLPLARPQTRAIAYLEDSD